MRITQQSETLYGFDPIWLRVIISCLYVFIISMLWNYYSLYSYSFLLLFPNFEAIKTRFWSFLKTSQKFLPIATCCLIIDPAQANGCFSSLISRRKYGILSVMFSHLTIPGNCSSKTLKINLFSLMSHPQNPQMKLLIWKVFGSSIVIPALSFHFHIANFIFSFHTVKAETTVSRKNNTLL